MNSEKDTNAAVNGAVAGIKGTATPDDGGKSQLTNEALERFRKQTELSAVKKVILFCDERKYYIIGLIVILLMWQTVFTLRVLGEDFSDAFSPWAAFLALMEMAQNGDLVHHAVPSLKRVALGLGFATIVAIPTGIVIGYFPKLEQMTYIAFQFLRMISPLAWMPIAIIIFGVGTKSVVFLLWLVAIWPLILNTAYGAGRVSQLWINMARTMGAGDLSILRKIIIPAAIPDMLTGLRLAVGISWIILVPAEMLGVPDGLGYFILDTRDRFRYDQLMATIVVIGGIGYLLDSCMRFLIKRYTWKI